MINKNDTSHSPPPKPEKRQLSGSGSRQGFRSTWSRCKANETLDAFRYRLLGVVAFIEKCQKNSAFILFLWLLLLIPIGYLAILGVHHTRSPGGGQLFFSKNNRDFLACEWVSNKYIRFGTLCLDSEPTSSPRDSFSMKTARTNASSNLQVKQSWNKDLLGVGLEDGIGWGVLRTGETSASAYQFNLTNAEPAKVRCIEFGASISSTFRMLVIDDRLIRLFGEPLEMRDISTGNVLDSIATPMGPKSYIYPLPGTPNFLVLNTSTNSTELYETHSKKLQSIQEWKALQAQPFQINDESYLASLLHETWKRDES